MLDKICRLFFQDLQPESGDSRGSNSNGRAKEELNLEQLFDDLNNLITRNQAKFAENEDNIRRAEAACATEEEFFRGLDHNILKRCSLRRIRGLRKRVKNLLRIGTVYNDNISMQTQMSDRLENIRVSGLKVVTPDMLENIEMDCEEMYRQHRDTVASVKAMADIDDSISDDQDLKELAKEFGVEI